MGKVVFHSLKIEAVIVWYGFSRGFRRRVPLRFISTATIGAKGTRSTHYFWYYLGAVMPSNRVAGNKNREQVIAPCRLL